MLSKKYVVYFAIVALAILAVIFRNSDVLQSTDIIKSPNDKRSYEYVELDNGLSVLLINDPEATKAAAAMAVNVGNGSDPKEFLGLAHFLEHMLFLGTDAFPEAGEYQNFIGKHGGEHNAFTAYNRTVYFFDIDDDYLSAALERFAPFFISPRFDQEYVNREINAIEAEYSSKYKDDYRRIHSALKQVMNPKHPYSKFSTGNLATLTQQGDEELREQLLKLYDQYYAANNMQLVIVANQPLEQIEELAEQHFSAIRPQAPLSPTAASTTATASDSTSPELFVSEQLPIDLQIEPIKEIRQLQFIFPMPEVISQYRFKPLSLIGHILGHEGEGSLLKFYKEKGWVESLSAGTGIRNEDESTFVIKMQLSLNGVKYIDEISQALFSYIDLLKSEYETSHQLPEYMTLEQKNLFNLAFQFQEKSSAKNVAVHIASTMKYMPIEDIIFGNYRIEPAAKGYLTPYLDRLTDKNLVRVLIAPEVQTMITDPWYDTNISVLPASMRPASDEMKQAFADAFYLPEANPFIPENFSLAEDPQQAIPEKLIASKTENLWFYPEYEFKTPKAQVFINLHQQRVKNDPQAHMTAELFSYAVNEALNSYSYPAYVAGLNYRLAASNRGIELILSGYHDKLDALLDAVIKQMHQLDISEAQFTAYKQRIERQLNNRLKAKPYERAVDALRRSTRQPAFNESDYLAALSHITREDVLTFNKALKQNLYVEAYVHGALSKQKALALFALVQEQYPASAEYVARSEILELNDAYQLSLFSDHPDNAIAWIFQGKQQDGNATKSDKNRAQYALLAQMVSSDYYTQLRTEQKLGYIVSASSFPQQEVPGILFIVQSPENSIEEITEASLNFFKQQQEKIDTLSLDVFNEYKQGLITKLLEPTNTMGQKAFKNWYEINRLRENFNSNEDIAKEVEVLTLEEIKALYINVFTTEGYPQLLVTSSNAKAPEKSTLNGFKVFKKDTLKPF